MAGARGFVAVVGARVVPESVAPQVAAVVRGFLARGWGIGSGETRNPTRSGPHVPSLFAQLI